MTTAQLAIVMFFGSFQLGLIGLAIVMQQLKAKRAGWTARKPRAVRAQVDGAAGPIGLNDGIVERSAETPEFDLEYVRDRLQTAKGKQREYLLQYEDDMVASSPEYQLQQEADYQAWLRSIDYPQD